MPISLPASPPTVRRLPITALCVGVLLSGCAVEPPAAQRCEAPEVSAWDPAESLNRGVFGFNRVVDDYALKPVAHGYLWMPDAVQEGVHNFATNFAEPKVFVNDLLQGNGARAVNTLGRFTINTTVGVLGLFDASGYFEIPRHTSDFGQTFGVWGIAGGPTVELPLLGTSNSRDAVGKIIGFLFSPFPDHSETLQLASTAAGAGRIVDQRAVSLPLTNRLEQSPDYYLALRDYVATRRAAFVVDGREGATLPRSPTSPCIDYVPGSEPALE